MRWKSSLHGAIPMRRQRWLEVEGFCEVVAGDADGRVGRLPSWFSLELVFRRWRWKRLRQGCLGTELELRGIYVDLVGEDSDDSLQPPRGGLGP